jgi:predicted AlkP superfamily pyrophosphatase or phosphodiesterase
MRSPLVVLGCSILALSIIFVFLKPGEPPRETPANPPPDQHEGPSEKKSNETLQPVALKPLPPRADGRARLAVLIVFDQMRGDYLSRWHDLFGDDGFRRLMHDGAWFRNCHYPYAFTVTGAGHASLATGCSPDVHGVVGNVWYDRNAHTWVYCTNRTRDLALPFKERRQAGPDQLLVDGLGDALTQTTQGKGRVVSLSIKDRSAILMAGRGSAPLCLWQETRGKPGSGSTLGHFVTNPEFYHLSSETRRWLAEFNARKVREMKDLWNRKAEWTRLHDNPLMYALGAGPDDVEDEGTGAQGKQGRTFPHPLVWPDPDPKKTRTGPDAAFYGAVQNSPFGNEVLLDLAKEAIDQEGLGRHETPDLLCVSFSSNDFIGHCWGPDSQEVMDVTLRSDRVVAALLAHLDARVGKGNHVVCITADHGVCPLPQDAAARGLKAGRVLPRDIVEGARKALQEAYPAKDNGPCLVDEEDPNRVDGWLTIEESWLRARGIQRAEAAEKLAAWLRQRPNVMAALTRADLMRPSGEGDAVYKRVRQSFYPDRCGDVALVLKPYWMLMKADAGYRTTHGTPHEYDTHVPLLIYGTGVSAGLHDEAVTPQAATLVLGRAIGVTPPSATTPMPVGVFAKP